MMPGPSGSRRNMWRQVGGRGIRPGSPSGGRLQVPVHEGDPRLALEVGSRELAGDRTACPARSNKPLPEPGRPFRRVYYLRAAQAYMLISMPTGTSKIFGVFQLISVSPKQCWHDVRAGTKTRWTSDVAQARNIRR